MLTKDLGPLVLSLAVAGPASAEVKSATPTGFEIVTMATISAPAGVYAALGEVGRLWSPSHTFSRDAGNLSMELHAGGCFCERLRMAARCSFCRSSTPRRARGCVCAVRLARCRQRASTGHSVGR
jgi:hypothetical protein